MRGWASLARHSRQFGRLFAAHAISRAGDAFNAVALVIVVYRLTGSGLGVAGVVAFEVVPILAFGPIAGLLADRLPRRTVMVAADLFRALLAVGLAVFHDSLAVAYGAAFGLSLGSVAFGPAASSLVPDVVDDEEIVTANAGLWTVAVVAQIVLAPLSGALVAAVGAGAAFTVNAVSFVVSALLLVGLRAGRRPAAVVTRGWRSVTAGVRVIRSNILLTRLALVQVLASLSAGATGGLLIVLADERLGVGPTGFGTLLAAIGVGAALGPTLLRRHIRPARRGWLFGPFAVRGGVDLALASTTQAVPAAAALAVYGMSTSTGMVAYQSTLQTLIPPDTRGRAFAVYDVLWNGSRLVARWAWVGCWLTSPTSGGSSSPAGSSWSRRGDRVPHAGPVRRSTTVTGVLAARNAQRRKLWSIAEALAPVASTA